MGNRVHPLQVIRSEGPFSGAEDDASQRAHRIDRIVREHFSFVWRVARRFGLATADADDATQQAMVIAARRLDDLAPGKERAFLFRVVTHVVAKNRRSRSRRHEDASEDLDQEPSDDTDPERLLDQRQAREQLDHILSEMSEELRATFVLFELEGFVQREIAIALGVPEGTVASRLRRAREQFTKVAMRRGIIPTMRGGK